MARTRRVRKSAKALQQRLFAAANSEEIWSEWSNSPKPIDQIIHSDLAKLVAKSREQYANNDYVKRLVNLSQTNIVGDQGVMVQSTVLDRRGEPDIPAQQTIERAWNDFSIAADTSGYMSLKELEDLVIQGCIVDGDVFLLRHVGKQYKYGVAFSFIDPVLCDPTYHDSNKGIISGIEYQDGRPVRYWFNKSRPKHFGYMDSDRISIPADDIIHVYLPEWVGQKRGLPWIATSLGTLRQIAAFEDAAIIAARVGATKMGFFTSDSGAEYTGEENDEGDLVMDAEPGSFEQLPAGLKLQEWNPNYPSEFFGEFISSALRRLAVGNGVAHHSLTGDMSQVNYTQGRTALLDERDMWKRRQAWLINRLVRPVYQTFIKYGVDFGRLNFQGKPLRESAEHYYPATYQGRRWAWVDPMKDMGALKEAISYNLQSLSGAMREMGRDPETVWAEIAKDKEVLESLGIVVDNSDNATEEMTDDSEN